MTNKAVFFDRDGTIMKDKGYLNRVSGIEFYKDTVKVLKSLQDKGYKLIGISNQSGIGRGFVTDKKVREINKAVINRLKKHGIILLKIYYCPHLPEENCSCRKPGTTMVEKAKRRYKINLSKSFIIGDKLSDVKLSRTTGMFPILLLTGNGKRELKKAKHKNFAVASNLTNAEKMIATK